MFDLGDVVPLSFQIKDASGALANGGTVTLTISQPDGTSLGPNTLTPTTTGVYDYDFLPTQIGRHVARCVSTGANTSSFSDAFDVAEATAAIISLADARAHMKFPTGYTIDDEDLRSVIESATSLIEHEVGPIVPRSHVEVKDATETILLAKSPVMSLTSIEPTFVPPGGITFGIPAYTLDGPSGMLRQQPFFFAPWGFDYGPAPQMVPWQPYGLRLTITYMAGRPIVPAALQEAAKLVVADLWKSRTVGGNGSQDNEPDQMFGRESMTPHVYELLRPYRRAPRVA